MPDVMFEWDAAKNRANVKKHGISFNEAITVFDDPNVMYKPEEKQLRTKPISIGGVRYERRI